MRKVIHYLFEVEGDDTSTWSTLHAYCEDGTLWYLSTERNETHWVKVWKMWELPEIPDEPKS